ncbi:hypothetical protein PACTADRAFT_32073 [Pachysolen tannophilus NRRL Y-2460]|uniref:Uncharacterized protein n=1 Tax=Pachysolen tannophilus NRRL Y-2460 TaxID=669874 RepID=A0A1E4TXT3_PACTA|nr:hypothetical protein PACTADRAFT_32073 [Pachysolen tannophilus NRRL Y-2460]
MPSIEVIKGNIHKSVPDSTYEIFIKPLYEKVKDAGLGTKFDPDVHLSCKAEDIETLKTYTLQDLGITNPKRAVNDFAACDPLPLFTQEAIDIIRREIMTESTFKKYARLANLSTSALDVQLGGFTKYGTSPFLKDALSHPRTLEVFSKVIGLQVRNFCDFENGHINFGIKSKEQAAIERESITEIEAKTQLFLKGDSSAIDSVVNWHFDSNPYTAVIMLSPTDEMIGGETALTKGSGEIVLTKQTPQGSVSLVQAGAIRHLALLPFCVTERIAIAQALLPADPLLNDVTVITTIKPSVLHRTRYNEFYPDWIEYRMGVLEARVRNLKQTVRKKADNGEDFDQLETIEQLKELINYVKGTYREFEVIDEGLATID